MDKKTTQTTAIIDCEKVNYCTNMNPKKTTLDFLKQFARTYSYESKLGTQLGNFIAN